MSFLQTFSLELLKIAALAAVYGFIVYCVRFLVSSRIRQTWLKYFKYPYICILIGGSLLVYSFTYYGNHGLGDSNYLPVGHSRAIVGADVYAFFRTSNYAPAMYVDSFLIRHDKLCMDSEGTYYICYLPTGELKKFDSKGQYDLYASNNSLPVAENFRDFKSQYDRYWHGWRKWVLP